LFWDTILIRDYDIFLKRARHLITLLDDLYLKKNVNLKKDKYLFDLYLRTNENVDYRGVYNDDHRARVIARKNNISMFTGPGSSEKWEYFFEMYNHYLALIDTDRTKWISVSDYCTRAIKCLEELQRFDFPSYWCWHNLYKMHSEGNLTKSYYVGSRDPNYLSMNILGGMYNEKASIMKSRMLKGEKALFSDVEDSRQWTMIRWFQIYSRIIESGKMPSGINKRVYEAIMKYSHLTDKMELDSQILVNESMYSMKKNLGYYQERGFQESMLYSVSVEDPFEYVKDIYLARGFLGEKKVLRKGYTMKFKDLHVKINQVSSEAELMKELDSCKLKNAFFDFFVFNGHLSSEFVNEVLDKFDAIERKNDRPASFRLVHEISPGRFGCPESFQGMV
jgi:hypothetical protein